MTLPADVARCPGYRADGELREGCPDCQRLAPADQVQPWGVIPPAIIVFECEYRIPA